MCQDSENNCLQEGKDLKHDEYFFTLNVYLCQAESGISSDAPHVELYHNLSAVLPLHLCSDQPLCHQQHVCQFCCNTCRLS